jgi:hypothetical protein
VITGGKNRRRDPTRGGHEEHGRTDGDRSPDDAVLPPACRARRRPQVVRRARQQPLEIQVHGGGHEQGVAYGRVLPDQLVHSPDFLG